eukprot:6077265-Karenia_brevis.AAC.1
MLANPSVEQVALVEEFVRDMVGGDEDAQKDKESSSFDDEDPGAIDTAKQVLLRLHQVTESKDGFVKTYFMKDLKVKGLHGTGKDVGVEGKPSRLDNLKKMIQCFPYLFKQDFMNGGYKRLKLDVSAFSALALTSGLPDLSEYPSVFEQQECLKSEAEFDSNFAVEQLSTRMQALRPEVGTQMAEDDIEVQLTEVVVNLENLKKYHRTMPNVSAADKAEKTVLGKYLKRLASAGQSDDRFPIGVTLLVEYIRKAGRLFAVGVSQQCLSNKSRSVCSGVMEDAANIMTFDVDFVACIISAMCFLGESNGLAEMITTLIRVRDNPAAHRNFLKDLYSTDEKTVKQMLYRTVFGAKPTDGNPLLWSIAVESSQLAKALLDLPEW